MSYEVLARKWRPQQFGDVVGQDHVVRTLKNAIENNRVAHAYLFVGPRGTGKTSTARIFSKALNCEAGPTAEPCDSCDMCREIMAGNSLDVLEIDGASNNGVEQVRDLRENVKYAPARGRCKIYIIDEVHMLSIAAFNALLKTLEEPPAHVKFMFATTEPQKVPPTILSRCQRFDLRRIPTRQIMTRLEEVARAEGAEIQTDALLAIARGAEGGLRDAESALDQLIAFRGKSISEEDVLSVFGLVAWKSLEELTNAVLKGNVADCIRVVAELDEHGKDIQRLLLELLEYFRNLLVLMYTDDVAQLSELTDVQVETLNAQRSISTPARVMQIVQILTEGESRIRHALSKRTLLEIMLIRCARAAVVVPIEDILRQLNELKKGLAGMKVSVDSPGPPGPAAPPAHTESLPLAEKKEEPRPVETPEPSGSIEPPEDQAPGPSARPDEIESLMANWHDVVEKVGRIAPLAKSCLLDAKPVKIERNALHVGFDPEFAGSKDKMGSPRNSMAVKKVLSDRLGRTLDVEFFLLDSSSTLPGDTKYVAPEPEPAAESKPEPGAAPEPEKKKTGRTKTKQEWIKDPVVNKTLEMFNGTIVDIRE